MTKEIFYYITTIIIPTLFTLYSLGHIVFVAGEFKEHIFQVPKIFLIFIIKLVFLSALQMHTFHYLFHNYIPENFYFISILINFYIMFEMIVINKLSNTYLKFLSNINNIDLFNQYKFDIYILKTTKKILKNNIFIYTFIEIFGILIGVTLSVIVIHNYSIFNLFILSLYCCILLIKRYTANFMSTLP